MFAVPSFFGYNTTFVSTPVATAATGVGSTSFTANWNAFAGASYYLLDVSTSSSFSSFVGSYQNFVVLSTSQLVSGLTASTTYYYRLRAATGVDADAAAFFSRIYTAGGALSYTEVSATETLVANMKSAGIWTSMKAVYPMIGASAAACAQNLKSSSFTGTFTSGWTFASTGATPNGTSAYMNTNLNPNTIGISPSSIHISNYLRTNSDGVFCDMGAYSSLPNNQISLYSRLSNLCYNDLGSQLTSRQTYTNTNSIGYYVNTRTANNIFKMFKSNSLQATNTVATTTSMVSLNVYIGANNEGGSMIQFSNRQNAFASIGDGLTDTQASNLYTAVNSFQVSLSRNV